MMGKESVACIGLGAMGSGIAARLAQSGFNVTGYDVSSAAIQDLVEAGGKGARSPQEAVVQGQARILICMVATVEQVPAVLFDADAGAINSPPSGAAVLLCITVALTRRNLDTAGRQDVVPVDCPVSGGADRPANGTLSILYSSSNEIDQSVNAVRDCGKPALSCSRHCCCRPRPSDITGGGNKQRRCKLPVRATSASYDGYISAAMLVFGDHLERHGKTGSGTSRLATSQSQSFSMSSSNRRPPDSLRHSTLLAQYQTLNLPCQKRKR